jgi:hypothetical protein
MVGEPRGRSWREAALQESADQPALGRLVEVRDHRAPPVALLQDPHRHGPAGQVPVRPPERCVRRRADVDHQPGADGPADGVLEPASPVRRHRADPGQGDTAGQPVRRDPVGGTQQPEQRRRHRQPRRGPPSRRGIERAEVERVVQHARVDPVGTSRRRLAQPRVRRRLLHQGGSHPEGRRRVRGPARRTQAHERVEHRRAVRPQVREAESGQVERAPAARGGLGLGGRQEDEHASPYAGRTDRTAEARSAGQCPDQS